MAEIGRRSKKKARDYPRYWKPLEKGTLNAASPALIEGTMRQLGCTREEAIAKLEASHQGCEYWVNDLYQVEKREYDTGFVQLNIRRRDGSCDLRDWRHFQEIKNQLVGPECEAIELYPAESRKVDTSNKWHLWAVKDPTFRFPIGWQQRDVSYASGEAPGHKQRSL